MSSHTRLSYTNRRHGVPKSPRHSRRESNASGARRRRPDVSRKRTPLPPRRTDEESRDPVERRTEQGGTRNRQRAIRTYQGEEAAGGHPAQDLRDLQRIQSIQ